MVQDGGTTAQPRTRRNPTFSFVTGGPIDSGTTILHPDMLHDLMQRTHTLLEGQLMFLLAQYSDWSPSRGGKGSSHRLSYATPNNSNEASLMVDRHHWRSDFLGEGALLQPTQSR